MYYAGIAPPQPQVSRPALRGSAEADKGYAFRRRHRLIKREVVALLRDGARLARTEFAAKISGNMLTSARIAIAIPKRILRLSVDRNRVKRIIREEFRQHAVRHAPLDLLITLRSAVPAQPGGRGIDKQRGKRLRLEVSSLLDGVSRRMSKGI